MDLQIGNLTLNQLIDFEYLEKDGSLTPKGKDIFEQYQKNNGKLQVTSLYSKDELSRRYNLIKECISMTNYSYSYFDNNLILISYYYCYLFGGPKDEEFANNNKYSFGNDCCCFIQNVYMEKSDYKYNQGYVISYILPCAMHIKYKYDFRMEHASKDKVEMCSSSIPPQYLTNYKLFTKHFDNIITFFEKYKHESESDLKLREIHRFTSILKEIWNYKDVEILDQIIDNINEKIYYVNSQILSSERYELKYSEKTNSSMQNVIFSFNLEISRLTEELERANEKRSIAESHKKHLEDQYTKLKDSLNFLPNNSFLCSARSFTGF
jgi:hypothetical protein